MSDPFTVSAIAGPVTLEISKAIVKGYATRISDTKIGSILKRLNLVDRNLEDKLIAEIDLAAKTYFKKYPQYKIKCILEFFGNDEVANLIGGHILNFERVDIAKMQEMLALQCGIPRKTQTSAWPRNLNPDAIIFDFLGEIKSQMSKSSETAILHVGNSIGERLENIEVSVTKILGALENKGDKGSESGGDNKHQEFESIYLSHLVEKSNRLTTPGVRELHGVKQTLSIAYIPLNLSVKNQTDKPVRADHFFLNNSLAYLVGPAGSGKTTLLNWLILQCGIMKANNPWAGKVPFLIQLRHVARTEVGTPKVKMFADYSVDRELFDEDAPKGWVGTILRQKRAVLMIDGVDEYPQHRRKEFWNWLEKLAETYPDNSIIVTSRPLPQSARGSKNQSGVNGFVTCNVLSMSDVDIREFIEHWHNSVDSTRLDFKERSDLDKVRNELPTLLRSPENRAVRELCGTPLLCAIVCVLNWREEGYLPARKSDLYEKCCDMLIDARDLKRKIPPPKGPLAALTKDDKEMVLQRLAFDMMRNSVDGKPGARIEVAKSQATNWIAPNIRLFQKPEARQVSAEEVIDHLIERTGLLREPAGGLIDYPHRSFQEYLAAGAAGALNQQGFLANQVLDDLWHETIVLAAGTPSGGIVFGRALIEALLSRARRNKSKRGKVSSSTKDEHCTRVSVFLELETA